MTWQTWREAMTTALYGPDGFYRREAGPAAHFRTSVHVSSLFAQALARLAVAVHVEAGAPGEFAVVDVGAGRGELLHQLAPLLPEHWRLIGVDVVDRPPGLPARIQWRRGLEALESVPYGLLVANEWLDNVPLDVVVDGRLVEVDAEGAERAGGRPAAEDLAWCSTWRGAFEGRIEVGRPRDEAWALAATKVGTGLAVAIDYAFSPGRDGAGSITGYRGGRQVPPVPDGSCDLTAHVLFESCAERAGVGVALMTQRHALSVLGLTADKPALELARSDPGGYLHGLARASEAAELMDPHGLGGFVWLLHPRDVQIPDVLDTVAGSLG